MAPRLNCVDMSKWGGPLTKAEAECLVARGIRKVIVGTGTLGIGGLGQWSRVQADAALKAGMDLDAYIYLYMNGSPEGQVQTALNAMQGIPVGRWWLDAEDTRSPNLHPADRVAFLVRCVDYMVRLGFTLDDIGIYTGRWWWVPYMANSHNFSTFPLWNSWYDNDPDTDGLPYGGWTDSLIEQFTGTVDICGQSVDSNYDKSYDLALPLPPEEDMADPVLNDLLVIQRDLRRTIEQPHPAQWQLHKFLFENGKLKDPEFKDPVTGGPGDYRGYA